MDWSTKPPQPGREKMSMAQPPTVEVIGLSSTPKQTYVRQSMPDGRGGEMPYMVRDDIPKSKSFSLPFPPISKQKSATLDLVRGDTPESSPESEDMTMPNEWIGYPEK